MGWNPANWSIVNDLQGQPNYRPASESGFVNGYSGGGGGGGGGGGYTPPNASAPAPAPAPQYQQTTGTGGGGTPAAPAAPAFDWQGKRQGILDSVNRSANTSAGGIKNSILDFTDQYKANQGRINNKAIDTNLAKIYGTRDINDQVGRNIRSSNVMLSNKNAGDSSASAALAQAYGQSGQRQMGKVGQQYEAGMRGIQGEQEQQLVDKNAFDRKYKQAQDDALNNIVDAAQQQISSLQDAMQGASITDQIDIQAEINAIKANASAKLHKFDQLKNSKIGGVKGLDKNQQWIQANQRSNAGTQLGQGMFEYDNIDQTGMDNGVAPPDLPIYTTGYYNQDDQNG